jgi:phage shock protein A
MTPPVISTMFVSLAVAIVVAAWIIARHLSVSRQARAALTTDRAYRGLADEYRRLSDMAITAEEHTELKLTELTVQVSDLSDKLDRMQRILDEVE